MDFAANQTVQIQEMLEKIGVKSIDALFESIPTSILLQKPEIDDGLSEYEGKKLIEEIAKKNCFHEFENYLGAGSYEHHIPEIVRAVCAKSEFLTSYTPYQAEASQGMLQAIFEFQSAICAITGMDLANASLYDGGSACSEALLMSLRVLPQRKKVVIAESVHPHYRGIAGQYLKNQQIPFQTVPFYPNGKIHMEEIEKSLDEETAAILVQYPNFFGIIDPISEISHLAKKKGVLLIICANPLVYGLYSSAKELGADLAVGDIQPFGIPMQFGGPYAGYLACKQELMRQIPGRLVGQTVDSKGKKGFVLTMQTREQHIRREKATSNICTNQALCALAGLIAMLWYGKQGIRKLALTNFQRASYLKQQLEKRFGVFCDAPIFNEFTMNFNQPAEKVQSHFRKYGIEPGLNLGRYYPQLDGHFLVAVTETKNLNQLNRYIKASETLNG